MTGIVTPARPALVNGVSGFTIFCNLHHGAHTAQVELLGQKVVPSFEDPRRIQAVLDVLANRRFPDPVAVGTGADARLFRAHDRTYVRELADICAGLDKDVILPTLWAGRNPRLLDGHPPEVRLARWSHDVFTSVGAGTFAAASNSVACVLAGLDLLVDTKAQAALALGRPPHHHAGPDYMSGYCYHNGSAIAALEARDRGLRPAVLDVDFHHGNGTQDVLLRTGVLFCSLHGDPRTTFPYHSGFADEIGEGLGEGMTLNLPLAHGAAWPEYSEALATGLSRIRDHAPDILIVSLGVDTYAGDPIGKFKLQSDDFLRLGKAIAAVPAKVLFVMEGGYDLGSVGTNVVNVLEGFLNEPAKS